jgi:hypothetical protein
VCGLKAARLELYLQVRFWRLPCDKKKREGKKKMKRKAEQLRIVHYSQLK